MFINGSDQGLLRCSIPKSVDGPFKSGVDGIVTKNLVCNVVGVLS